MGGEWWKAGRVGVGDLENCGQLRRGLQCIHVKEQGVCGTNIFVCVARMDVELCRLCVCVVVLTIYVYTKERREKKEE